LAVTVKATWAVQHECGHTQDHDLSAKPAGDRAGLASWLASKDCSTCWRAKQPGFDPRSKEEWLAERRAAESAEVEAWETKAGMLPLSGSDKSVDWGRRVRRDVLSDAFEFAGPTEDEFESTVLVPARTITRASWWIDQREADPADIEELVTTATSGAGAEAGVCENV